ncbi:MAG: glycosyltransferase family 4 protein [bacterium]
MNQAADATARRVGSRSRVILVAFHYHPDPAVGSLRARNAAQALAAAGHDVHVVCSAIDGAAADSFDGPVHVVRVTSGASPRDMLSGLKRVVAAARIRPEARANKQEKSTGGESGWKAPQKVSVLRRWIGSVTWLPDDRQGFILPAARAAEHLMRGDGTDVLYTTAPPFSGHLVGLVLRLRARFRWMLEFRDPWTDNTYKPWFVRSWLTDRLEIWAERRCLMQSDVIVTVTSAYADVLRTRHGPPIANKVIVARNGIPQIFSPTSSDTSRFRVVYAGTFYLRRDPNAFLTALARVNQNASGRSRRLDVQFVGDCRNFDGEALGPKIDTLGLSSIVTFVDWLPHADSVELMRSADLLLLFAQDQPLAVPNKLYEYLGMGIPILAFADDAGETALLLRDIGGHFVITEKDGAEAIEKALMDAIDRAGSQETASPGLQALATSIQMKTVTNWLDATPVSA